MEEILSNPITRHILDHGIAALDRLVDEVLERNLVKKPCQRIEIEDARLAAHV